MTTAPASYDLRRRQLEEYFDRTAADAWARLTSDAPVGSIRATVRAGRDQMRALLLSYLPADLAGQRVLDAGCGTGALAVEAARRGAEVVAVDHSPTLIALARERVSADARGRIDFRTGDMLDPALGRFDWVVAMDSIIHYQAGDMADMIARLATRAERGAAVTFAPRTPLLTLMHLAGQAFPRANRSPDLVPIAERVLRQMLAAREDLAAFDLARSERVDVGFYKSQTLELVRR
ncbi:MAG: magnesium protoporphyrin IX methyltransferase [Polyangiaceae bacterium]|jgi:magnesium-protoporphyrin O-methyltransferase|nr:magnesium protoporphyrin IX methyltransferase [Polyangiaceae bacterium]